MPDRFLVQSLPPENDISSSSSLDNVTFWWSLYKFAGSNFPSNIAAISFCGAAGNRRETSLASGGISPLSSSSWLERWLIVDDSAAVS